MRSAYSRVHNSDALDEHARFKMGFAAIASKLKAFLIPSKRKAPHCQSLLSQTPPMRSAALTSDRPPPYTIEGPGATTSKPPSYSSESDREPDSSHAPHTYLPPSQPITPPTPPGIYIQQPSTPTNFPVRFALDLSPSPSASHSSSSSSTTDSYNAGPRRKQNSRRKSPSIFNFRSFLPSGSRAAPSRKSSSIASRPRSYTQRSTIDEPCSAEFLTLNARRRERRLAITFSQLDGHRNGPYSSSHSRRRIENTRASAYALSQIRVPVIPGVSIQTEVQLFRR